MKVNAVTEKNGKVTKTKIGKPKKAFTAVIKEAKLAMNFSYGSSETDDGKGNKVQVYLWITGDWKIEYKDKEYIIPISENVNALIEWINSQEAATNK